MENRKGTENMKGAERRHTPAKLASDRRYLSRFHFPKVRMTEAQHEAVRACADAAGLSVSGWLKRLAAEAVREAGRRWPEDGDG